jgi:hypothetical protein
VGGQVWQAALLATRSYFLHCAFGILLAIWISLVSLYTSGTTHRPTRVIKYVSFSPFEHPTPSLSFLYSILSKTSPNWWKLFVDFDSSPLVKVIFHTLSVMVVKILKFGDPVQIVWNPSSSNTLQINGLFYLYWAIVLGIVHTKKNGLCYTFMQCLLFMVCRPWFILKWYGH